MKVRGELQGAYRGGPERTSAQRAAVASKRTVTVRARRLTATPSTRAAAGIAGIETGALRAGAEDPPALVAITAQASAWPPSAAVTRWVAALAPASAAPSRSQE